VSGQNDDKTPDNSQRAIHKVPLQYNLVSDVSSRSVTADCRVNVLGW